ncbi:MAG TPA: zonular occludens toxin domain-containing protein [Rhodocyclaceae bacterium]|nr:zonular occludens toxin domain-containing protein [Rhodocyclaceae bacterium]
MDYLVSGKKRNGKSLVCVGRIRAALRKGKRVATNLDLFPHELLPLSNKSARIVRLPDYPSAEDLWALGEGCDNPAVEVDNGVLVLDEMAILFNSRTFNDKGRKGVLDWLAQSGKLGWDTYLICQHPNQIDKQIREALCEYHVICRRLDRLKIPLLPFKMPRLHVGFVKFGMDQNSVMAEKWIYRGSSLFKGYNTIQKFSADYPHGSYSVLPPWHSHGRYQPASMPLLDRLFKPAPRKPVPKPKRPEVEAVMALPADARIRALSGLQFA